jgi:hypothetical protein
MFQVLSNGKEYRIIPTGNDSAGWHRLGTEMTKEQGFLMAKKDWDHFWSLCGLIPTKKLIVAH